jgi:predicted RNA binding protein YcfA (HicA-like mRNA interferase family)
LKLPRDLYGRKFADHLIRHWEYRELQQTGSHIILRTEQPTGQTMPIPAHKPLRLGTLATILRMIAEHKQVSREDLLKNL